MIPAIKKLMGSVFSHTMKKEDVLSELMMVKESIYNEINPSIELLVNNIGDMKLDKDSKEVFETLMDLMKFSKNKGHKAFLEELSTYMSEIYRESDKLENIIHHDVPDYITDKTITARVSGILGTVSNFTSITLFTSDLLLYIIYKMNNDSMYYKSKEKSVYIMLPEYAKLYAKYRGKIKDVLKDINKLSDTEIGDVDTFHMSASRVDKKFNMPVNGFIGNPIYYFRMWMVEIEASKYEYLKDKKRLIELKLIDMKLSNQGEPDAKIQKQIEYFEEKLAKIEYEIHNIEE